MKKKIVQDLRWKTKKKEKRISLKIFSFRPKINVISKKGLRFESVTDFSNFRPKKQNVF